MLVGRVVVQNEGRGNERLSKQVTELGRTSHVDMLAWGDVDVELGHSYIWHMSESVKRSTREGHTFRWISLCTLVLG